MAEHTQTWHLPVREDGSIRQNCLGTYTIFFGHGERQDNQVCQTGREDFARLIAAAPDLLEACEEAIAVIESAWKNGATPLANGLKARDRIRNAIRKVKGGA